MKIQDIRYDTRICALHGMGRALDARSQAQPCATSIPHPKTRVENLKVLHWATLYEAFPCGFSSPPCWFLGVILSSGWDTLYISRQPRLGRTVLLYN